MNDNNDIDDRIAAIEEDLRTLAAISAKAGNWPVVRAASMAAESLESLKRGQEIENQESISSRKRKSTSSVLRKETHSKKMPAAQQSGSIYPRFIREKDDLVKIGWSKREKEEYQHRAKDDSVFQVARAIEELANETGTFNTDELFPVICLEDGSDVPSYQSYLILRWFRSLEIVEQRGRSEYIVPEPDQFVINVKEKWQ